MECRPTEHGWAIEYTDDETRLREFIRTAAKECGGLLLNSDREEYRKEILWLIKNKPCKNAIRLRSFNTLNAGLYEADMDMLDAMYSDDALKAFYAELDKFGSRGCL